MYKRCIITICIIPLILLTGGINANASTRYGFETIDLSVDEINDIWENIEVRTINNDVVLDKNSIPIVSFDVSENGNILLGLEGNKILVVDENKNVLCCFQFSTAGTFYVQWEGENILLMLVRSSVIVEFTTDGQLISMVEGKYGSTQNNDLRIQISQKHHVTIGDSIYFVRNKMGFLNFFVSSYSQLVKKDATGNETIIYDVSTKHTAQSVVIFIGILILVAFSVWMVVLQSIKAKHRT